MKHILDKSFKYKPSHDTDIRKTFDRIRREQAEREKNKAQPIQLKVRHVKSASR